jgi:hypothetical protein
MLRNIWRQRLMASEKPSESNETEKPTWDLRFKEPKRCEVHGLPLQAGLVEIAYGLYDFDEAYLADKEALFPNSHSWVMGGCINFGADVAQVDFCPLCREAEGVWQQVKKLLSTALEEL